MATSFKLLTTLLFLSHYSSGSHANFTVELIHRDSPRSPLYNPLETRSDRLAAAFRRSISRSSHFKHPKLRFSTRADFQSGILSSGGEYFMTISLGTPPSKILGILDTGSDLTWLQCKPCLQCYEQTGPIFDSEKSSTYKKVPCDARACYALESTERGCDRTNKVCEYSYSYADGSFTKGNVATEKISADSSSGNPISFPGFVFGCGHNNGGTFDSSGSGIVGLGGGQLSLISQVGSTIGKKFSYCLSHMSSESNKTGVINFGGNPTIFEQSKAHVVSTPLVDKEPVTYYYLTLEAISVGKKRLPYTGRSSNLNEGISQTGNIIIDSGTTLTLLDSGFYEGLVAAVEEAVTDAERVSDPEGLLSLCFNKTEGKEIKLPEITVHFTRADVKLGPTNAFVKARQDLVCFSMIPTNEVAIYGNLAQMDFLVGYDLEARTVSFLQTDCSDHF